MNNSSWNIADWVRSLWPSEPLWLFKTLQKYIQGFITFQQVQRDGEIQILEFNDEVSL